jgi:hypothetical protein
MHRLAPRVFSEGDFHRARRRKAPAFHRLRRIHPPLPREKLHCAQPPPACQHRIPSVRQRHHREPLQQPLRFDQRRQLADAVVALHPAHVRFA